MFYMSLSDIPWSAQKTEFRKINTLELSVFGIWYTYCQQHILHHKDIKVPKKLAQC